MPSAINGKYRVLYCQPGTTRFAGIERVVDTICSELARSYHDILEVDVLLVSEHVNHPPCPRDYNIVRKPVSSRFGLMKTFRKTVRDNRYDLVVVPQIEPTVILWMSCLGLKPRIAMHLHGNPRRESGHVKAKILFFILRHVVLRRISSVFGTSPRQLKAFIDDFECRRPTVWTPNPVRTFQPPRIDETPTSGLVTFVNVGRFDHQKGQDILIGAFALLYSVRQDIRLRLVGYGHTEAALKALIQSLGLTDIVSLEYLPDNPQHALYTSDVFVATSRWEGWSLAICEALRCGLPVISTDCEFGPSDILVDSRLGHLVPSGDLPSLVDAMGHFCDTIDEQKSFAEFRRHHISQYDVASSTQVHADAILQAISL